ncbi:MAG: hypothetical protein KC613_03445 [Myxococcales bacterium]|nr:hypothetical protein [Myxococcales bacterium]MCB9522335.1 hypothetical protein [Myxococcales bacterium]
MTEPTPALLLTVTVESDRPRGQVNARTAFENLAGVARLGRLCERFGVRPTWLVSWPVMRHAEREQLDALARLGEVGTCLQPWVTPPFRAQEDRLRPVCPAAIPASAVAEKMAELTRCFEETFGGAPTAHRAPSAGLDGATLQALERHGYLVDSSATPHLEGPVGARADWRRAPEVPWFPDRQVPATRGSSPVLEVPVTIEWDRPVPSLMRLALDRWSDEGTAGKLRRQVARPRRLDPLALDAKALRGLAERTVARGIPCLNMPLRSRELVPGCSARALKAEDVDRLFHTLEAFLRFTVDELRATPTTLTDFARSYVSPP